MVNCQLARWMQSKRGSNYLKRIALYSKNLLAAPSASDVADETMGTTMTKADGRRSARLARETETGGGEAAPGGTAADATGVFTCGAGGGDGATPCATELPLTAPGRPALCGNADRCGQASRFQSGGFGYCCGRCFQTYAAEHSEICGWWHAPDSAETESALNDITPATMYFDAGQDTLNLVGTQEWTLAPSSARVDGLGGDGVGVLPATVFHPCKTYTTVTEYLSRLDCGDGVGRFGIADGLVRGR